MMIHPQNVSEIFPALLHDKSTMLKVGFAASWCIDLLVIWDSIFEFTPFNFFLSLSVKSQLSHAFVIVSTIRATYSLNRMLSGSFPAVRTWRYSPKRPHATLIR